MTVNELTSALRTLLHDCPEYGDVPVLVQARRPDGYRDDLYACGIHTSDGAGVEGPPQRLLLTIIEENFG